ncbi:MAG: N-terminal phage integrase SAM-like domain-containing protein, partial [Actinomycetota bacterium]|nr:N-terminal phage integrase SAM-like domain-containing protein [Actinomycetota bacterium]
MRQSKRTVEQLIDEWLSRRQHSITPSMHANYRNYARYYIYPYIGKRKTQDLDSAVFDALYAKLLTSGRVKANSEHRQQREARKAAHDHAIANRITGKRPGPAPKPRPAAPE